MVMKELESQSGLHPSLRYICGVTWKYEFPWQGRANDNLMRIESDSIAAELLELTFGCDKFEGELMVSYLVIINRI